MSREERKVLRVIPAIPIDDACGLIAVQQTQLVLWIGVGKHLLGDGASRPVDAYRRVAHAVLRIAHQAEDRLHWLELLKADLVLLAPDERARHANVIIDFKQIRGKAARAHPRGD